MSHRATRGNTGQWGSGSGGKRRPGPVRRSLRAEAGTEGRVWATPVTAGCRPPPAAWHLALGCVRQGNRGSARARTGGLGHEFGTGPLGKTTQITVSGDRSPEARLPGESEGPDSSAADTVIHTAGSGETGRGPTRPGSPSPPGRCKRVPGRERGWWKKVPFM